MLSRNIIAIILSSSLVQCYLTSGMTVFKRLTSLRESGMRSFTLGFMNLDDTREWKLTIRYSSIREVRPCTE